MHPMTYFSPPWTRFGQPRLTARSPNSYTLSLAPPPSNWTPPLHSFLCTAYPPPTPLPTLARNSPHSTPGLRWRNNPGGSALMNNGRLSEPLQLLSPPPVQRHRISLLYHTSLLFLPHFALSAAYALAQPLNATTATSLATTPSNAPDQLPVVGVQSDTLLGNTRVPQLPACSAVDFVHMLHLSAPTATDPTRPTQPPVPNVQQFRNVLVERMKSWRGCRWSALKEEIW